MSEPLPKGQQMLLQRIMCQHCVTDDEVNRIFDEIQDEMEAESVVQCLSSINQQLTKCFGMEIVTMVGGDGEKYHAVINQHSCEISKNTFSAFGPELRDFTRLLLEALVEGPNVRSTLINLRSDLKEPLKLDLDGADKCIETLLEERWLSFDSKKKRKSGDMHAKIALGPRAYLELAHLLTDLGLPQDELPQFVFHR